MKDAKDAKTMHYGKVMKLLKTKPGARVARKQWMEVFSGGHWSFQDWYERGPCLILVSNWSIIDEHHKLKDFEIKHHKPFIAYRDRTGCLIPWIPSHEDHLAEDWIEV